jgi:hypothetical protein
MLTRVSRFGQPARSEVVGRQLRVIASALPKSLRSVKVSKEWWGGLWGSVALIGLAGLMGGWEDAYGIGIVLLVLLTVAFPFYYGGDDK